MHENMFIICKFILTVVFLTTAGLLVSCGSSSETKAIGVNQSNEANKKLTNNSTAPNVGGDTEITALDSSKIPTVSYCDLIKNARAYDKKIVRVRAIYFSGFEKIYLYDDRCEANQPPSAPENVPAETWAQFDKSFETKGDSAAAKLNNQLNNFGRKDVTVVGKFYSTGEDGDQNAPNRFGHLNCCRFQFSIMRVENVR